MNARSDRYAEREWRTTPHHQQPTQHFAKPIPLRRTIAQHKRSAFRTFLRLLGL